MSASQIIVLVTPVFLVLIALEWLVSVRRRQPAYRLPDAISSISLGMLSQTSAVFTRVLRIGIYAALFEQVAVLRADAFWHSVPGWLLALLLYDLCYYWYHRMGHEAAVLWAAHAVHHQSQDYNLSTALRQTSSGVVWGWVFYLPMALLGVPPLVFAVVGLVNLLYQFWVHTEQVGRLGWFDRWFCSPSNHRVHHAVNDAYLDKNYGGILVVWDRIFGTFKDEDARERCVYGTRGLLNSWDPLWANAHVYSSLAHDSWHTRRWADKLRVWLRAPGWQPADLAARFPKPAFQMAHMKLFHPPMGRALQWFAAVQFVLLLAAVALFLWRADATPMASNAVWFGALVAAQWALGAALQRRISPWMALMVQSAALTTATSALGYTEWYAALKPLTMVIAIFIVATNAYRKRTESTSDLKTHALLIAALLGSLAGDVFLLSKAYFIPGLLSFLIAHLFYIALFKRGQRWFAHRGALFATLGVGVAMYSFLWAGGMPAALRAPVAAYVLVIALMAGQAISNALHSRDRAEVLVGVGSAFFMLSDSLLATNRFVSALPYAAVWVLGSYYVAQVLIVSGVLKGVENAALAAAASAGPSADSGAAAAPEHGSFAPAATVTSASASTA